MDVKEDDNVCIVCWREIHVYAIGLCDHPVCHECSTRMRVLCRKSECPICRRNLPKVIFVKEARPFEELNRRLYPVDAHPQVCFEDDQVRQAYRALLENRCKYCPPGTKRPVFASFGMLRTHVRREHHRTYCDLCVEHLKIFPGERTAYSKKDLCRHLHSGDLEDTSHKGHPLCQFCDVRYFDHDELYRHLRREHYYCHFCGDDYRLQYYRNYEYLREHFRQEHFLCEEGDCRNETFTAAFRSEIDLKAHRAQHHNRSMTKAQAKQARTLDLEFSIAPRAGVSGNHEEGGHTRRLPRHGGHQRPNRSSALPQNNREEQPPRGPPSTAQRPAERQAQTPDLTWEAPPPVDYHCDKEFPQLGGEGAGPGTGPFLPTPYSSRRPEQVNFDSVDEFPSLNPSAPPPRPASAVPRARPPAARASSSAKPQSNGPAKGGQEDRNNNAGGNPDSRRNGGANVTVRLVQPPPAASQPSAAACARDGSKAHSSARGPPKPAFEEDFPALASRVVPRMSAASATPAEAGSSSRQQIKTKKKKADEPKRADPQARKLAPVVDGDPPATESSAVEPSALDPAASAPKPSVATDDAANGTNATDNLLQLISAARKGNATHPQPSGGESSDSEEDERRALSQKDFPHLNGRTTAAPPGFRKPKPPPGFARPGADRSRPPDVSLAPSVPQAPQYTQPARFQQRNLELIVEIQKSLAGDQFGRFKALSGAFRRGTLSAADYFSHCLELFGAEERFLAVFPELLFLLPDIRKQRELMATYNARRKACGASTGALPKGAAVQLLVCATCQQVLSADDFRSHRTLHDPA